MKTKPGRSWFSLPRPYSVHDPIDGRAKRNSPVCIMSVAWGWLGTSVCMLLIRHRSSACFARCGNRSEIHRPLWPCRRNVHGVGRSVVILPDRLRTGLPASAFSCGL
jgi:hypothetical protein